MAIESKELQAIRAFLAASGVPFRVTSTTSGGHAVGSYHFRAGTDGPGLAADLAGPIPRRSTQLLAVFAAFGAVESKLAELIYSGAPYSVKDGKRVPRYAVSAHWDHVHVAVPKGTFLSAPAAPQPVIEVRPMFDPPLQIVAALDCPTGDGTWLLHRDGGVANLARAKFFGSASGAPAFIGRVAARLEPRPDGGYDILATSGERYQFPAG